MKTVDELRGFFDNDLRDELRELQPLRGEARKRSLFAVLALGAGASGLPLIGPIGPWAFVVVAAGAIAALVLGVTAYSRYKVYRDQFKHRIIGSIIRFIDPSFTYSPNEHIPESTYEHSGIFRTGVDRYRGDDLVTGTIGKTEFRMSELHTEYKTTSTDSKGNTRTEWHTIFKGLFFRADFNKHFRGRTFVLPDTAERLFGFLGKALQGWNRSHGDLVKLEDPEFEREFVVYGSDQVEARYILSPSLMERILEYKNKVDSKIHLSFVGSWVNIAVPFRRDLWETSLLGASLGFRQVREYHRDLELAFAIVEDLNLNTRIWTKE